MINIINKCEKIICLFVFLFLINIFILFSELNSNDLIQRTHLISLQEVDIQLTNGKTISNETTSTNDINQVHRIVDFLLYTLLQ